MMKDIKVGILGAGGMAKVHAKNLMKLPGVQVVSMCARSEEDAKINIAAVQDLEAKAFGDFYQMLREISIDVLYVCLPPFAHSGQVEAAAAKGIHIFLEKPIALEPKRAKSMLEAIESAGVISQVGYHMRFGSAVKELKRMITQGEAGKPTLFDGRYDCNHLHSQWWRDVNKSGGQIIEQVIHVYDLSMHFFGKPESVFGFLSNTCHKDVSDYTVEDTSVASVRFLSGALANISASNCAIPMEWNNTFTVICEKVTAYFKDANNAKFVMTNQNPPVIIEVKSQMDTYFEETKAFIEAVKEGKPSICPIEEGCNSLYLVDAVVRSSKQAGTVLNNKN
ncbi:MAG TPA: Gfo/Idh/MocA family oxidoreductase [Ruminiclostridium sp.]